MIIFMVTYIFFIFDIRLLIIQYSLYNIDYTIFIIHIFWLLSNIVKSNNERFHYLEMFITNTDFITNTEVSEDPSKAHFIPIKL